jgi:hypothetical protein
MKKIQFSSHAEFRVNHRLNGLVSYMEVWKKVNSVSSRLNNYRNWVLIKKMSYAEIADPDVTPDGLAKGDMIVALVESGVIETVIIRKSWCNKSPDFKKIIH